MSNVRSEKYNSIINRLPDVLVAEKVCDTFEEAVSVVDSLLISIDDDNENISSVLQTLVGIPKQKANTIALLLLKDDSIEENDDDGSTATEQNDDDDAYLGPGECELCERYMKLTRHHLIPKSTWSRLRFTDPSFSHLHGDYSKSDLNRQTIDICSPCHSNIHKIDNLELAYSYNTLDKLLEHPNVYKFAKWASKQKVGKYGVNTNITQGRKHK